MNSHLDFFSFERFFHYFKLEILNNWKKYFLSFIVITLLYFTVNIMAFQYFPVIDPTPFFFISLFFGLYITSQIFPELHDKDRSVFFLLTPASVFEKWGAKLIISSLVYFILNVAAFLVIVTLINLLKFMTAPASFQFRLFFNGSIVEKFFNFLSFHSVFFFGAIYFKKNQFIKTLLLFAVAVFVSSLVFISVLNIYLRPIIHYLFNQRSMEFNLFFKDQIPYPIIATIIFNLLLPAVLYLLSWRKISNKEVA